MDTDKLGQIIYEKTLACGFDDCGIIPIDDMDGFQQRLQEREEKVPSSTFFYQGMGDFANIKKRFPWAKSVIIGTYWLGKYRFPPSLQGKYGKAFFRFDTLFRHITNKVGFPYSSTNDKKSKNPSNTNTEFSGLPCWKTLMS